MKIEKICILGGTGFVGSHLTSQLANAGFALRLLSRRRERYKQFTVMPQVELVEVPDFAVTTLQNQFVDCDAVINLIGILNGTEAAFHEVHVELPGRIVAACTESSVSRLLHMSALNADAEHGPSLYLRSKGAGEAAVQKGAEHGIQVTCFRPSVIFGADGGFFNRFATLLKLSPVLPLACPNARFAPVYRGDVVNAMLIALTNPASFGQGLELCGPRVYTLKELVQYTRQLIGCRCLIIDLSAKLAQIQAKILQKLPGQPFTMDNYQSLQVDSVCRSNGLAQLGITPTSVEAVMPALLSGSAMRDRYRQFREVSRR